jgi:hypothetical protein
MRAILVDIDGVIYQGAEATKGAASPEGSRSHCCLVG